MHKDNLKGHFITYIDKNSSYRTHKVLKVTGKTLTVKDALGKKMRIHPRHNKILGRQLKNKIEVIEWT